MPHKVSRTEGHNACSIAPSIFSCQRVILQICSRTGAKGAVFGVPIELWGGRVSFFYFFVKNGVIGVMGVRV